MAKMARLTFAFAPLSRIFLDRNDILVDYQWLAQAPFLAIRYPPRGRSCSAHPHFAIALTW